MWNFGLLDTLWLLVVVGLLVWVIARSNRGGTEVTDRDKARDARWLDYIGSFRDAAKSDHERHMIDTMLAGGTVEDLHERAGTNKSEHEAGQGTVRAAVDADGLSAAEAGADAPIPQAAIPDPAKMSSAVTMPAPAPSLSRALDGTMLLLYFGAFLFVASAGLFVAFGQFSGLVRTLIVIATMLILYCGGLWLHGRSARLRPAGISFVAIGLAVVPLVGVAAYNYLSADLDGRVVWLATSLLGLAMYGHALYRLRTPLLGYLSIFSFVSVFESSIAVLDLAAPYFVWGLIVVGLLVRLAGLRHLLPLVDEPAGQSARVLVPLGTVLSTFLLADHGAGQMSVALALGAAYYAVEATATGWKQSGPVVAAQVLAVASMSLAAYALTGDRQTAAAVMLGLTVLFAGLLTYVSQRQGSDGQVVHDISTAAFGIPVVAAIVALPDGILVSACVLVTAAMGALLTLLQRRSDAYMGGLLALTLLPYTVGQIAVEPHFGFGQQSLASFMVLLLMMILAYRTVRSGSMWREPTIILFAVSLAAAVLPAWLELGWTALAGSLAAAGAVAYLGWRLDENAVWATAGGVAAVPVLLNIDAVDEPVFAVSVAAALAVNLALAWLRRHEANRWLATGTGLLLPVALGAGGAGMDWTTAQYAYGYLAVAIGLIVCRAAARGVIRLGRLPATEVFEDTSSRASLSYAAGYIAAACLAVVVSLGADASRLHTSVILAVLLGLVVILSVKVEDRREILSFAPWLAQALLASVLRPGDDPSLGTLAIAIGAVLSAVAYLLATRAQVWLGASARSLRLSTLWTAYLPVWAGLFYAEADLAVPASLALAGVLTLHYNWRAAQAVRETSGAVILLALLWSLAELGITNLQVHTHVIAATFALYSFWRHFRLDRASSDGYLYAMFFTATVPLVLQALVSDSGGLYGWWLILQQVVFMVAGVSIQRRFLTWWGLYVSVAAVIYQLRHLGWAALTVLALFVIGIAVYRLARTSDHTATTFGSDKK